MKTAAIIISRGPRRNRTSTRVVTLRSGEAARQLADQRERAEYVCQECGKVFKAVVRKGPLMARWCSNTCNQRARRRALKGGNNDEA